jgi:hypothetical protein
MAARQLLGWFRMGAVTGVGVAAGIKRRAQEYPRCVLNLIYTLFPPELHPRSNMPSTATQCTPRCWV